jgi:hypothetical protein
MAVKKEDALYIRNRRPNRIIIKYADTRNIVERRGSRNDSLSLPIEAENDATVSRWLKDGVLERITKEQFMKLGTRVVDVEPNQYLKRPVRSNRHADLSLYKADGNTSGELFNINDSEVKKKATPNLEWNGELMTTQEELEDMSFDHQTTNYPSHHRES